MVAPCIPFDIGGGWCCINLGPGDIAIFGREAKRTYTWQLSRTLCDITVEDTRQLLTAREVMHVKYPEVVRCIVCIPNTKELT